MTMTKTNTEQTSAGQTRLPACRRCGRGAGLSGGICARCMYPDAGDQEVRQLDRALLALHEQAVRGGWEGEDPDERPLVALKADKRRGRLLPGMGG
jgi:ribosomal protein L37E